jgi:hypothetical protein
MCELKYPGAVFLTPRPEPVFDLAGLRRCENCRYWDFDSGGTIMARHSAGLARVGQCLAEEEGSPWAETEHADAFVFTQAQAACPAFEADERIFR